MKGCDSVCGERGEQNDRKHGWTRGKRGNPNLDKRNNQKYERLRESVRLSTLKGSEKKKILAKKGGGIITRVDNKTQARQVLGLAIEKKKQNRCFRRNAKVG